MSEPPPVAVVLDSDAFFRDFQRFLLSAQGFSVLAPDPLEDVTAAWVREQRPSVIVMEVLLPGKNGLELLRELRAPPGVRCPIIVYTVLRIKERALAAGADKFLLKPLMRESYLTALGEATKNVFVRIV